MGKAKYSKDSICSMLYFSIHTVLKLSELRIAKPISGKEQKILSNNLKGLYTEVCNPHYVHYNVLLFVSSEQIHLVSFHASAFSLMNLTLWLFRREQLD